MLHTTYKYIQICIVPINQIIKHHSQLVTQNLTCPRVVSQRPKKSCCSRLGSYVSTSYTSNL